MNWDRVQSNWKQLRGSVQNRWTKLTDQHLSAVEGKAVRREALAQELKAAYGFDDEECERQIAAWQNSIPENSVD